VLAELVFWIFCSVIGTGYFAAIGWTWTRFAENFTVSAAVTVRLGVGVLGLAHQERGRWLATSVQRIFCAGRQFV
jgi:hypothetical protein